MKRLAWLVRQTTFWVLRKRIGLTSRSSVYDPELWNHAATELSQFPAIVNAVLYGEENSKESLAVTPVPILQHLAGASSSGILGKAQGLIRYNYPAAKSHKFATPFQGHFNYNIESLSHTRSLMFLKPLLGGPYFDLEAIWDEHTHYEFTDRSMEHTMSTMVQEPYVNHVPTVSSFQSYLLSTGIKVLH